MTKRIIAVLTVLAVFSVCLPAGGEPWAGSGYPNDPYLIYTPEDMQAIGADPNYWDAHFRLMADIDLSGFAGTAFNIIGNDSNGFTGVFDGNDRNISNFNYTSTGVDNIGLFGCVGSGGEIKNLNLVGANTDAVTSQNVGSLVGLNWYGTVSNCYTYGTVRGAYIVGGLVGYNHYGTISNCYVRKTVMGGDDVGGLVGVNWGTVSNCFVIGDVIGDIGVGGLVANNPYGIISNCYSVASVTGGDYVGGLMGSNSYGTVLNCYAAGAVTGDGYVGGFAGYNGGVISGSLWDTQASNEPNGVGGGSAMGVTGKTTAQLQTMSTFFGWGCESTIWTIDEGNDYPHLAWENNPSVPGEPVSPVLSDLLAGTGTAEDPYLIYTEQELNTIGPFSCESSKHFKLMADIDLGGFSPAEFNLIAFFTGVFDGNGLTISDFNCVSSDADYIGLFRYVGSGGEIKELGIFNANIDAGSSGYVGALAGYNNGTISSCYSFAVVTGDSYVGGLVGSNEGTVTNCYTRRGVTGSYYVGGLIGDNSYGMVSNCSMAGLITGTDCVGGVVGWNYSGTVSGCYMLGTTMGSDYVGGVVGWNYGGTVLSSYAISTVSGDDYVGGLVGDSDGDILSSYATGNIYGTTNVGGLVGRSDGGVVSNCYSRGGVSGDSEVGGFAGYNGGIISASLWDTQSSNEPNGVGEGLSGGVTGKTTAEMQTMSTFFGWGCTPAEWTIDDGNDYPHLVWENEPGEPISPVLSDLLAGAGTQNEPYLIYTDEELNLIGLFSYEKDKHFKLMADIDLSGFSPAEFNTIMVFAGVFDGNDHTISNFTYDSNGLGYVGLFGYVNGVNAEVKNLGLLDPNVDSGAWGCAGSLVGGLEDGSLNDCYMVGGSVSGDGFVGGLVGYNQWDGVVSSCYTTGSVTGDLCVGGLVGNNGGVVSNCYTMGTVMAISGSAGGLAGYNSGGLSNCYATGTVTGGDFAGGFAGYNDALISASFWDIESSSQVGGIGYGSSIGVTGKTTADMQTASTFTDAGWDFVSENYNGTEYIWRLCQGTIDYPKLAWQSIVGDFVCPDGVNFIDYAFFAEHWRETEYGDINGVELTGDGKIDLYDFAWFAKYWMLSGCGECGGADYSGEGDVDFADLEVLSGHWLESDYGDNDGTELTGDGKVWEEDLAVFVGNWLSGV